MTTGTDLNVKLWELEGLSKNMTEVSDARNFPPATNCYGTEREEEKAKENQITITNFRSVNASPPRENNTEARSARK